MKKFLILFFTPALLILSCENKNESKTTNGSNSNIKFPYEAEYATDFNNNVSDSALLLVLNSYKYWENGDIKGLRSCMDDSAYFYGADGYKFVGLTDSIVPIWQKYRDSLSSIKITMDVWLKNHSVKDSANYISVWYKEIDTYKTGKVDSARYEDDNGLKNGKIIWYSSHRQKMGK